MTSQDDSFKNVRQTGDDLIAQQHDRTPDIRRLLDEVEETEVALTETLSTLDQAIRHRSDLDNVDRIAEQLEAWLAEKEGLLASTDYGTSLSTVEKLLRKHDALEKSLHTTDEKLTTVKRLARSIEVFIYFECHAESDVYPPRGSVTFGSVT